MAIRPMIVRARWNAVLLILLLARKLAVKDCDYGDRLTKAIDEWLTYTCRYYRRSDGKLT